MPRNLEHRDSETLKPIGSSCPYFFEYHLHGDRSKLINFLRFLIPSLPPALQIKIHSRILAAARSSTESQNSFCYSRFSEVRGYPQPLTKAPGSSRIQEAT